MNPTIPVTSLISPVAERQDLHLYGLKNVPKGVYTSFPVYNGIDNLLTNERLKQIYKDIYAKEAQLEEEKATADIAKEIGNKLRPLITKYQEVLSGIEMSISSFHKIQIRCFIKENLYSYKLDSDIEELMVELLYDYFIEIDFEFDLRVQPHLEEEFKIQ